MDPTYAADALAWSAVWMTLGLWARQHIAARDERRRRGSDRVR